MKAGQLRLAVLGLTLFVYLTAELFPIGALPELRRGLHTGDAAVGLLLTAYAVVAGLVTVPMVRLCRPVDRRRVLSGALVTLAVSQVGLALSPSFAVAAGFRGVGALAHGLVWSQVPVVAAALATPGQENRAASLTFVGSSLGLVLGAPLTAAATHEFGWRISSIALGVIAVLCAAAIRAVLPPMPTAGSAGAQSAGAAPWRPVATICLATALLVTGHYVSYSYFALIVAPAGLGGALLPAALTGYGIAGLLGVLAAGRMLDRRPWPTALVVTGALVVGIGALAVTDSRAAVPVFLLLWGAAAAALPAVLNTAALRVAPEHADTASGAYVTAYQVGISTGSALGAVLLANGTVEGLPAWSSICLALGAAPVLLVPGYFGRRTR